MKKILSVWLFSFLYINTFCQHAQVKLSEDFKFSEKDNKNQTVAHSVYHNNSFYTATNSGDGGTYKWAFTKLYDINFSVTVTMFDRNMNKLKEVSLSNGDKIYGPLYPSLFLLNNKLCLAYFQSDNKTSFNLYLAIVDEKSLSIQSPKKICTIEQENVGVFKIESVIKSGIVFIASSPDKSKTLVTCKTSPNSVQSFILDNNLNVLKQSNSKTTAEGFDISTAVVTNENVECYVLSSEEETKIICNSPDGKKTEARINGVGEMYPISTNATISKDGKSIFVYSTTGLEKDRVNTNGLLVSQLECNTMKLSKPIAYEFDQTFLEAAYQKGAGDKHRKEFRMYNFSPNLMEMENGSLVILGSPEKESTTSQMSAMNSHGEQHLRAYSTLEVGPVIAIFPNKGSKGFKYALVPRKIDVTRSASSGAGAIKIVEAPGVSRSYSSFAATSIGDEIAIIYNDNEKNLARAEDEKVAETDRSGDLVLAEALINKDHKLQYRKQIEKNLSGSRYTYFLGNTVPTSTSMLTFPIGKEGNNFNMRRIIYTNWCFLEMQ